MQCLQFFRYWHGHKRTDPCAPGIAVWYPYSGEQQGRDNTRELAGHLAIVVALPAKRKHQPVAFCMRQWLALGKDVRPLQPGESHRAVVLAPGLLGLLKRLGNRQLQGCVHVHAVLFLQQTQAVEYHQQADAHIGKDGHPHSGFAGQGDDEKQGFDAQRQDDVLLEDGRGLLR